MTKEELDKRIKAIVHGNDMPDHFMSDSMLAQPIKLKRLISAVLEELLPPYRDEDTERDRGHNDVLDIVATRRTKLGL